MDLDLKDWLSPSGQVFANLAMALTIITGGLITYFRKIRSEFSDSATLGDHEADRHYAIVSWLSKLVDSSNANTTATSRIVKLLEERAHSEEMHREYMRGRDERDDRKHQSVGLL